MTLTIGLCIAGYFVVGYAASVYAYVRQSERERAWDVPGARGSDRPAPSELAAIGALLGWPLWLAGVIVDAVARAIIHFFTRPHVTAAALVQRLNTPAPIQEPGAFAPISSAADSLRRRVAAMPNTTGQVQPVRLKDEFVTAEPVQGQWYGFAGPSPMRWRLVAGRVMAKDNYGEREWPSNDYRDPRAFVADVRAGKLVPVLKSTSSRAGIGRS